MRDHLLGVSTLGGWPGGEGLEPRSVLLRRSQV